MPDWPIHRGSFSILLWGAEVVEVSFVGAAKIHGWLDRIFSNNIQVKELDSFQVTDGNVTWTLAVSVDEYRNLGIAPLIADAKASVESGKVKTLTLTLAEESAAKFLAAELAKWRAPSGIQASGFFLGIISLGLFLPAAAIYYVSRVKSLFAAIPRLERPWLLLEVGLASLFFGLALTLFRDMFGLSPAIWDGLNTTIFILSTAIFLVAMVLMKRAWTIPSSE